jgi:hypothetical protein
MGVGFQVTIDAADPRGLAGFWAAALGYVDQPPPPGFGSWEAFLDSVNWPADQRDARWALIDPDGAGPRLFFQKVPEPKAGKNRVHLDLNVGAGLAGPERRAAVQRRAAELTSLGARPVAEVDGGFEYWIVMADPEGNEFCLQ